ncbi:hypothetical protein WJX72_012019 [[Myrmecia] bisecta]|uniref:Fe2OG dioxygenase domain-containing protein n=1 Tax=[Myrmecia] bisecta TaxID=41462 RepID=A0AAW1P4E8_9CHLO
MDTLKELQDDFCTCFANQSLPVAPPGADAGLFVLPHKQVYDARPGRALPAALASSVGQGFATLDMLARLILTALAQSPQINMPASLLATLADDMPLTNDAISSSVLSVLRYVKPSTPSTPSSIVTPGGQEHVDKGLLTIVYDDLPGLQVQSSTGEWQDVTLGKGQIAVFAGYTLERATCGLIPRALHRVRTLQSSERMSLCFKLRGRPSAMIDFRQELNNTTGGWKGADWIVYNPQLAAPIRVADLMAEFDAVHSSVNRDLDHAAAAAQQPSFGQPDISQAATGSARRANSLGKRPRVAQGQHTVGDEDLRDRDVIFAKAMPEVQAEIKPEPGSPAAHATEDRKIKFRVRGQDGADMWFLARPSTKIDTITAAFARKRGMQPSQLIPFFQTERVERFSLEEAGIQGGDVLDMLLHQYGD